MDIKKKRRRFFKKFPRYFIIREDNLEEKKRFYWFKYYKFTEDGRCYTVSKDNSFWNDKNSLSYKHALKWSLSEKAREVTEAELVLII